MTNTRQWNEATYTEDVLKTPGTAVVDFWAPWCGPCVSLGPTVEALASETAGEVVVGKINIDENPELATRLGITSIPTLIFYQDGEEKGRVVGSTTITTLRERVELARAS